MINKITIAASLSVLSHCASAVYMSASSNKWLGASNSLGNPHKTFIYHGATISLGQSMPVSKYVSAGLDIGYGHNLNHKNAFNNYDELQTHIKYSIYADAHLSWHMSQALSLYGIVGYGSTMLTEDNNQFDYNESFFDTDSAQSMAIKGIRTGIGFEAKISENVSLLGQWVISRENNKLMSYRVLSRKLTSLDRMTNTICNASIGARWTF